MTNQVDTQHNLPIAPWAQPPHGARDPILNIKDVEKLIVGLHFAIDDVHDLALEWDDGDASWYWRADVVIGDMSYIASVPDHCIELAKIDWDSGTMIEE